MVVYYIPENFIALHNFLSLLVGSLKLTMNTNNTVEIDCKCLNNFNRIYLMNIILYYVFQEKVDNWYHLLTENIGRKKHLAARKPVAPSGCEKENKSPMPQIKATPSICVSVDQKPTTTKPSLSKSSRVSRKQVTTVSMISCR